MKKQIIGGLFALFALFFTVVSCRKDIQTVTTETNQATGKADAIKGDFYVENGTLRFKNVKSLLSTVDELSKFDISERYHFGEQIGFKSYLSCFAEVLQKSSAADDKDYDNVLKDYADVIDAKSDGTFKMRIVNKNLASVLDRNGIVYIGKRVYRFTDFGEAIAINGDVERLKTVTATTVSDDNIKVIVSNSLGLRGVCGKNEWRDNVLNANGTRKADFWNGATKIAFITEDEFGNIFLNQIGQVMFEMYISAYSIGTPWKPRSVFSGWKTYNADNTLSLNQSLNGPNNITFFSSKTYSNSWTAIDFGTPLNSLNSFFNLTLPEVNATSENFKAINNTYSNTSPLSINITCN
jgi:hypothetical protein